MTSIKIKYMYTKAINNGQLSMNVHQLAEIFNTVLEADMVAESGGIQNLADNAAVGRIGLLLDWDETSEQWVRDGDIGTVWVHRYMRHKQIWPTSLNVISHHAAYDRRFGLAHNTTLHQELKAFDVRILSDRPALSLAAVESRINQDVLSQFLRSRYGGIERNFGMASGIKRMAFADGMRPEMLTAAASAGAEIYITGQWRPSGEATAEELGMSIISVGHEPQERKGLIDLYQCLINEGISKDDILIKK